MQRIDPSIEKPTRDLLGHAVRGELDQMGQAIYAMGDQRYMECTALCIAIAGYVAIDASGMRWPSDSALREMANHTAETTAEFEIRAADLYDFLSRVAFGSDKLDQVFPDLAISTTFPVLAAARILVAFRPHKAQHEHWWQYLDAIEGALEQAAVLDPAVLPALMLRVHSSAIRS